MRSIPVVQVLCTCFGLFVGCGTSLAPRPAPLFTTELTIEGEPVGPAVLDTGGGYELILRETFGLTLVEKAEVLAFGGTEVVDVTEGFRYSAGGWNAEAEAALVGVSVCECNGVGFHFFRKTGAVLGLDFPAGTASFLSQIPQDGVRIPFAPPPPHLDGFRTAFVRVELRAEGERREALGLLDTGTNRTVMRRGLVGRPSFLTPDQMTITVTETHLGTLLVHVALFETDGLPDIILGTDALGAWSDRWYFLFTDEGGTVVAYPNGEGGVSGRPISAHAWLDG